MLLSTVQLSLMYYSCTYSEGFDAVYRRYRDGVLCEAIHLEVKESEVRRP